MPGRPSGRSTALQAEPREFNSRPLHVTAAKVPAVRHARLVCERVQFRVAARSFGNSVIGNILDFESRDSGFDPQFPSYGWIAKR